MIAWLKKLFGGMDNLKTVDIDDIDEFDFDEFEIDEFDPEEPETFLDPVTLERFRAAPEKLKESARRYLSVVGRDYNPDDLLLSIEDVDRYFLGDE